MPREIRFRAKDTVYNEWIYANGYYFDGINYWFTLPNSKPNTDRAIAWAEHKSIKIETLGQLADFKDEYGQDVYEADIISNGIDKAEVKFGLYLTENLNSGNGWYALYNNFGIPLICPNKTKVIGNIHDDPELLK